MATRHEDQWRQEQEHLSRFMNEQREREERERKEAFEQQERAKEDSAKDEVRKQDALQVEALQRETLQKDAMAQDEQRKQEALLKEEQIKAELDEKERQAREQLERDEVRKAEVELEQGQRAEEIAKKPDYADVERAEQQRNEYELWKLGQQQMEEQQMMVESLEKRGLGEHDIAALKESQDKVFEQQRQDLAKQQQDRGDRMANMHLGPPSERDRHDSWNQR